MRAETRMGLDQAGGREAVEVRRTGQGAGVRATKAGARGQRIHAGGMPETKYN